MKQGKYTHVIWDWNGTLLDDVGWCIQVMNIMLSKRNLPVIHDRAAYHLAFGFPVIDYYRRVGFDFAKEPFETLAEEFMNLYHSDNDRFRLFDGVSEILAAVKKMELRQVILSASKLNNLRLQTNLFDIEHYFDEILGISDIYAGSKIEIGLEYMKLGGINKVVLIGDTVHDHEAAEALGADCVLVAHGHQSKSVLLTRKVPVVDDITEVLEVIKSCVI